MKFTAAVSVAESNPIAAVVERVCRTHHWQKFADGPRHVSEPLTEHHVRRHLARKARFGACPITPGESTTRLAVLDFDSHDGGVPRDQMLALAERVRDTAELLYGLRPVLWWSSGGQGIHAYLLWDAPQDAASVRETLRQVLNCNGLKEGADGVAEHQAEIFPKQSAVAVGKAGNMFYLPGAGKSERITPGDDWPLSDDVPRLETPAPAERSVLPETTADTAELRELLTAIPNEGEKSLSYDEWFRVVCAVHHAMNGGDEGLALVEEFSARSEKADLDFLRERVWPYITSDRDNPITVATLRKMARDAADPAEDFDVLPAPATEAPQQTRFPVVQAAAFADGKPPAWIVRGVLPDAEIAVVYGESTSGKSFLVLDLGFAVARGAEWRGRKVRQGAVVYVAAEGAGGFRKRLQAYARHHDLDLASVPLGVIDGAPNLLGNDWKAIAESVAAFGGAGVIVVDTLAQTLVGGNENAGEDVGKAVAHCKRLHAATGALVVLIHHAGKDATKGARGWSGLRAAADAEIEVVRKDAERQARITKQKDGDDGEVFPFRLQAVHLGVDEEMQDVTSCVVQHHNQPIEPAKKPAGRLQRAIFDAVHDLMDLGGETAPVDDVIARAIRDEPYDPGPDPDAPKRDQRATTARRALAALCERGMLVVKNGTVSLAGTATNVTNAAK